MEVFVKNNNEKMWKDRWNEICELGKEYNFQTMIFLQPTLGTISPEKRIPVDQEFILWNERYDENNKLTEAYLKYSDVIPELNQNCTVAKDFKNIFDDVYEAIFYDYGHTNSLGNEIIATHILEELTPVLQEKFSVELSNESIRSNNVT